jgi:hypothetical protein
LIAAAILGKTWLVQELLATGSAVFVFLIAHPAYHSFPRPKSLGIELNAGVRVMHFAFLQSIEPTFSDEFRLLSKQQNSLPYGIFR